MCNFGLCVSDCKFFSKVLGSSNLLSRRFGFDGGLLVRCDQFFGIDIVIDRF